MQYTITSDGILIKTIGNLSMAWFPGLPSVEKEMSFSFSENPEDTFLDHMLFNQLDSTFKEN